MKYKIIIVDMMCKGCEREWDTEFISSKGLDAPPKKIIVSECERCTHKYFVYPDNKQYDFSDDIID